MKLAKESRSQRLAHQRKVASSANNESKQKDFLHSAIAWAGGMETGMETRLETAIENCIAEFCARKSGWGLDNEDNERPHEITDQVVKSRRLKFSAYIGLAVEILVAAATIWASVAFYIFSTVLSFGAAVAIATVATLGVAWLVHGGLIPFFDTPQNPLGGYRRLSWFVIFPTLVALIVAVAAYGAVRNLDASTLLWAQSGISFAIYLAIFGFWGLGTGLLMAADIHDWSISASDEFQALESELQEVRNARREWLEKLNRKSSGNPPLPINNNPPHTPQIAVALPQTTSATLNTVTEVGVVEAVTPNATSTNGLKSTVLGLMLLFTFFLTACEEPQIKKTPVAEKSTLSVVVDVSGIENREALQTAGLHIRNNLPKIIKQFRVTDLDLYWFGANGWNAEKKAEISIPPFNNIEVVFPKRNSEVESMRPDIKEAQEKLKQQIIISATTQEDAIYQKEIERSLASLKNELLSPDISSSCTDINGALGRFTQPINVVKHIILIITDGRQNCDGEIIKRITVPENAQIIFVIVSGTKIAGQDDFEVRKQRVENACSECKVVPHYSKDFESILVNRQQLANAKAQ